MEAEVHQKPHNAQLSMWSEGIVPYGPFLAVLVILLKIGFQTYFSNIDILPPTEISTQNPPPI